MNCTHYGECSIYTTMVSLEAADCKLSCFVSCNREYAEYMLVKRYQLSKEKCKFHMHPGKYKRSTWAFSINIHCFMHVSTSNNMQEIILDLTITDAIWCHIQLWFYFCHLQETKEGRWILCKRNCFNYVFTNG